MKVGHKLIAIVVASVALVIVPASIGIYLYLKQNLLATEAKTLISETQSVVTSNTQTLLDYEFSLKALSRSLAKTLAEPPKAGESAAFDRLVQQEPDRAWRSVRKGFDGKMESGIFLPPDASLNANQKSLHLRTKNLLDIYGTSISSDYENIWLLTRDKTEVIYDHLYPEFVFLMKADTDYTKTPWITLGDPTVNPNRGVRWTPPMHDPVSGGWLISAVLPIDVNGRWIGTVGRDINILKALPTLMQKNHRYEGGLRFLMDEQGNFIDAGPWQKLLENNPEKFKLELASEPELAVLLGHREIVSYTHMYDKHVTLKGVEYLAIDAPIPYLGWRYTRLVPIDEVLAPMRELFYSLMGIVLAIALLIGFLIDFAVQRNIVNRLQTLASAVRRYGLGDTKVRASLTGDDELAKTSQEFDTMVKRLDDNERELKLVMDSIPGMVSRVDNRLHYVFVSGKYSVVFQKPIDQIVGHPMREIMGEDLYQQEEPYIKRVLAGEAVSFEISTPVLDLGEMHGLVHFIPNFDENNHVDGFFTSVTDITERKKIEQDLLERDARWKFAIEGFGDCLWDTDEVARTINYSKAWFDMIGFAENELTNSLDEWELRIHPDDKEITLAKLQTCLDGKTPNYDCEHRVLCKDGNYRWIHDRGIVLNRSVSGKALRMVGITSDVSARKQLEVNLKLNEERWKFAIEGSGFGVWDWNIQADVANYSKQWKEMLGYSDDEILPTSSELFVRIHPEDQERVKNILQAYLEGRSEIYAVEFRLKCKDGSYKWILARGMVVTHTEDGKPSRMIGTHADITERKENEIQLNLAATAFESQEGIMITDADKKIVKVNAAFTKATGYSEKEVFGQTPRILSSGRHDASFYKVMWDSINAKGTWTGEVWNKRKNGEIYPEQLSITAVKDSAGHVNYYVGSVVDITERKKTENALIESEYRSKFAIEGSGDGVWDWDIQTNQFDYSTRWKEILGYSPSDILPTGDEWENRFHPADKVRVEETMRSYLAGESPEYVVECRLRCKDGSYKWIQGRGMVVNRDENGKPLRMIGTSRDIDKSKKTEQALIESEYRSKFAIEGSGDGVWDVNVQTNEAIYSKRWAEMLGYEEGEILPNRDEWRERIHPDDKQRVIDAGTAYLEGKTEIYVVEYRIQCKDEQYKWMLSRGMIVSYSEDGRPLRMIGTQVDITDRKLAEDKLKRMQVELIESRDRYVDLYEFAPIGYLSVTKHGMITEVNWRVTALLGLPRKQINDHRFEEFVAEDDKAYWRRQFSLIKDMQGGEELTLTLKLANANATIFIASLHCLRIDEDADQPILRVTVEDVTQLKNTEQVMMLRESYQRSLLDNFPFMVWLKDDKHRYLAVNQSFANACGYASHDLLPGRSDLEVWPRELAKKYRNEDIDVLTTGQSRSTEELIDIKGKKLWFETYKSPVMIEGKVVGTVGFARDIHARKQAEMFEQFRSRILGLLIENITLQSILEAIVLDVEQFNPDMLCSILLLDKEGKHLINVAAPSLPAFYNAAIDGLEIGPGVGSCGTAAFNKERVIATDLSTHPYWENYRELASSSGLASCWSQPIFAPNGSVLGTFAIYHRHPNTPSDSDINLIEQSANLASIAIERKYAEDDLRIASIAFESQEGMMVTDAKNIILKVNQAFCDITGYSSQEAVGHTPRLLSSSQHSEGFYDAMWECVHATGHWAGEVYNRRKNGEVFPQHLTVTVVKDENGAVTNHVATLTDITMNKAAAEEIKHLAFYDSLTGLPNRRLMVDRLNQALVFSARTGRDGAVLFLDLDHFKTLNDSLGHDIGDMLLQQVAERLVSCVREGDTVARLGGDEYVVLLEDLSEEAPEAATQVENVGEKILAALNKAYQLGQHEYHSTPSIGVALFSNHNQSQEELLKHADIAMYQAKKAGRNTIRFFDPKMQEVINTRVDLERELRKALDKQQLHLYYQIQVDVSGRPMGAEALIRWLHPEHGLVSPFHFIPLAEETGLILPIGQWVLETACKQLKAWEENELTQALTLSINVSAKQFRQADFVNQVQEALKRYEINPMLLKLELTESMLLDNIEDTVTTMNKLKEIGIRFSLDDFGTGYSSLQYLKRLPLYQLKIDQSFVRDIAVDSSDQAIVRTIIAMAHTLNLNVIAEGVETLEQQGLLLNNGCTHYQGYFYGRPLPIEQFEVLLRA